MKERNEPVRTWPEARTVPHDHAASDSLTDRRLQLSIILTSVFVLGEAVAGYYAQSLALLSDAGHNFADVLALVLSWYARRVARRPADARRTFGYHRAGILAALVNAVSLVVIALLIFGEAFHRLREPEPVHSGTMIAVAILAVALNGVISLWLHQEAQHDLNVRSAYLHMLGDAVAALGVVAAGVVIALTGSPLADPVVSLFIGLLILWSSWGIMKESVDVLLEAAPKGIDMAELEAAIRGAGGIRGVHDLHVWTITSGIVACSCHIVVDEATIRSGQQVLQAVTTVLRERFGIGHTTIQVEVEGCEANDLYCTLRRLTGAGPGPAQESH